MANYDKFNELVKKAVSTFRNLDKKDNVRIISHLDADGICSASILIKALLRENIKYSVSIVPQLKDDVINEIAKEEYDVYFFTDLGSGQINTIKKYLDGRCIFVLDHHTPKDDMDDEGIIHVNPHLVGIGGDSEISGAGVVFNFAKELNEKNNDMAHIAVIGAIGDVQERDGFRKLNQDILDIAIQTKKVETYKSLRFFGAETRPLYKLLVYSTDPYIPGVSGNESGAIQFLNSIGINPKVGDKWRKLNNLTKEEMNKLTSAIVIKRQTQDNPHDIIGDVYKLICEEEGSPTRDAREFSTLLNSCGRMNKSSLGIGACLGDPVLKKKAISSLSIYRKELMTALKWYDNNKNNPDNIIITKGYMIINARHNVMGTIIGTVASIVAHNNETPENTFILSLARLDDNTSKVSLRYSSRNNHSIDLKSVIEEIVKISGGEAGGHAMAAGAMIPTAFENKFLDAAKKVLDRKVMEEAIVFED